MRTAIHLVAVLAFAACALPAHADAFDSFNDFCVASHGNAGDAIAAADKAGWTPAPAAIADSMRQALPDAQLRVLKTDGVLDLLVAGHGAAPNDPRITGRSCILTTTPGNWTDFAQRAATVASVPLRPEFANEKDGVLYIWREENGAHVPISGSLDLPVMTQGGILDLMALMQKGNSAFFVFFVTDPPK